MNGVKLRQIGTYLRWFEIFDVSWLGESSYVYCTYYSNFCHGWIMCQGVCGICDEYQYIVDMVKADGI